MQAWRSQSKAAKVFTRVAVATGLVIIGIHYNQHQERQNMRAGPLRDEIMYQEKLKKLQQEQQQLQHSGQQPSQQQQQLQ